MLVFEKVGKHYRAGWRRRRVAVFENIDLTVRRGEIFGLSGPSGGGKSTLAKMVPGLVRPSTGKVLFNGEDISVLSGRRLAEHRRKAQIVFQDPLLSLDPKQTVFDAVAEPLKVHGLAGSRKQLRTRVMELLADCGLGKELAGRLPREISGGQAQRVVLARALGLDPELIVGDETTSMLDLSVQAGIMRLLMKLRQERGLTLFLISHDPHLLDAVCDRKAVLENGSLQEPVRQPRRSRSHETGAPMDGERPAMECGET